MNGFQISFNISTNAMLDKHTHAHTWISTEGEVLNNNLCCL